MSDNKIPQCPNCEKQMVLIWYHEPNEIIEQFVKEKKIFYRGLELKDSNETPQERIIYHCYNCNRSYSQNLEKYIEESKVEYPYQELDSLIDELATEIINKIDDKLKEELKKQSKYSHFGFGLYIRNNFVYNNDKIKYRVEADSFSHKIYDKIMEKLSE